MLRSGPTPWPPPPRQWAERNAVVGEGIAHGNCTGRRQHCARHCEARRHGRWLPPSVCLARIRSRARDSLEMLLRRDLSSFSERTGRETAQIQENFRAMEVMWTVTQGETKLENEVARTRTRHGVRPCDAAKKAIPHVIATPVGAMTPDRFELSRSDRHSGTLRTCRCATPGRPPRGRPDVPPFSAESVPVHLDIRTTTAATAWPLADPRRWLG